MFVTRKKKITMQKKIYAKNGSLRLSRDIHNSSR
jgi:hypothetical protein